MATTSPEPSAPAQAEPAPRAGRDGAAATGVPTRRTGTAGTTGRIVTAVVAALVLATGAIGALRSTRIGFAAVTHGPYPDMEQQETGMRCLADSLGAQVPSGSRIVVDQIGEEPVFWTQRVSAMAFEHGVEVTDRDHAQFVVRSTRIATPGPCGVFAIEVETIPR